MGICITIRIEDTPNGFENYLRKFMARYYPSVEIRYGDIEDIVLDGSPTVILQKTLLVDPIAMVDCRRECLSRFLRSAWQNLL